MNTPPKTSMDDIAQTTPQTDADRLLVELMRWESVSAEGLKEIQRVREFSAAAAGFMTETLDKGGVMPGLFLFLCKDQPKSANGIKFKHLAGSDTGVGEPLNIVALPVGGENKDVLAKRIRQCAVLVNAVAVAHLSEAWVLWNASKEDHEEIETKYGGQVRNHPKCADAALVSVIYNVRGEQQTLSKMWKIDETVKPRKIEAAEQWTGRATRMTGRFCVETELLHRIE